MIYTASLSIPVRKALSKQTMQSDDPSMSSEKSLGKQVMQSNLNKICDQMSLDPDVTDMDVVILGPQDVAGPKLAKVNNAMATKHPGVCVIYLYNKAADEDKVDTDYKKQCKKITSQVITEAFEEFAGEHQIRQGKRRMTSADFDNDPDVPITPKKKKGGLFGSKKKGAPAEEEGFDEYEPTEEDFAGPRVGVPLPTAYEADEEPQFVQPDITDSYTQQPEQQREESKEEFQGMGFPIVPDEEEQPVTAVLMDTEPVAPSPLTPEFIPYTENAEEKLRMGVPDPAPIPTDQESVPKVEDMLANITSYEDWSILKEHLNRDSIVKALINENSEYLGLVKVLEVLDRRLEAVWRDTALTPDEKFDQVKEIGLERSSSRGKQNSIYVDKLLRIISTIVLSAKRTVEEKVDSVDVSLYRIAADRQKMLDTSYIDNAIKERTDVQMSLLQLSRSIVDLYKAIDTIVVSEIEELDRHLPSSNQFINEMVKPIGGQIFTPANTSVLANKLMRALQENSIVASQMEESVNSVIEKMFELCDKDEEIIRYQQQQIEYLRANRVEEVVITNTLMKKVLRLYTGADNTGRSATAITWCGILSRRQNSLLIDLTGRAKFREYGITPMRLDEFMTSRVEKQFLCVESDHIPNAQELQEIVEELKSRLNYYPYVNIIMAPEDTAGIEQMSDEALCIHYITDCSTSSIKIMKDVIEKNKTENIARKLITIDTPVSPLMIADSVNIDPTLVKIIMIPSVSAIRACSLRHDRPYEYTDIVRIYEEAFR